MAIDVYVHSHQKFLLSLGSVRVRYDAKAERLQLLVGRVCELPPAWVKALIVEALDERTGAVVPLPLEWGDVEPSLMSASCPCPDAFLPRDFSQDFVPIATAVFKAGGHEVRLPNGSSPKAFLARPIKSDPTEPVLFETAVDSV